MAWKVFATLPSTNSPPKISVKMSLWPETCISGQSHKFASYCLWKLSFSEVTIATKVLHCDKCVSYPERTHSSLDLHDLRVFQLIFGYFDRVVVLLEHRCKSMSGNGDEDLDLGCLWHWKVLVIGHNGQLEHKTSQGKLRESKSMEGSLSW